MDSMYTITAVCAGVATCYAAWVYAKPKIMSLVVDAVLDSYLERQETTVVNTAVVEEVDNYSGHIITIPYLYGGEQYKITLPYGKAMAMSGIKATAVTVDGQQHDMTQQPGIPYLFTPQELGLQQIILNNTYNGVTHCHTDDAPLWGDSVAYEE